MTQSFHGIWIAMEKMLVKRGPERSWGWQNMPDSDWQDLIVAQFIHRNAGFVWAEWVAIPSADQGPDSI